MNLNLNQKVVVVTGGAKGIGEGICEVLAEEGAVVAMIGRNETDNRATEQRLRALGGQVFSFKAELTEPDACQAVIAQIADQFGRIDGLVNNAGINDGVGLETGDYESFISSLHRNLVHYYLMAQYALPFLKISKGAIVNISSKTAETGQGGTSGYAASNGGRNALTREWAVELLPYGIRVNAVVVAECYTPLYEKWIQTLPNPEEALENILRKIPLERRMTTTREIADMVAFLISERSSHTTGQLIHVDGGYVHLDRSI
ncbi:MAG: SDR family oxidoreductase [Saprospiraceae bacterium]|nr:SDR family oxidoreductase [Saprospiraceae bacterium]